MGSRRRSGAPQGKDQAEGRHWGAIIGAIGTVVAAAVAGLFMFVVKDPPPPECPHSVVVDEPENGQEVDGTVGVAITGKVCGLMPGDTLWVFEFDPYDRNFYLVYDPAVGMRPVASRNGGFAIHDGPVGDPGDYRKRYEIVAAVGDQRCRREIESTAADQDGNYVFDTLPDGCRDITRVQILESQ
ncbi:hypothetical protein [Actinophytocola sp. KF-1]